MRTDAIPSTDTKLTAIAGEVEDYDPSIMTDMFGNSKACL